MDDEPEGKPQASGSKRKRAMKRRMRPPPLWEGCCASVRLGEEVRKKQAMQQEEHLAASGVEGAISDPQLRVIMDTLLDLPQPSLGDLTLRFISWGALGGAPTLAPPFAP
jgi:hypothetical protein